MFVENISQFVIDFINGNKNPNVVEAWNSKKNQEQLVRTIKKNNIVIKDPLKPKRGKSGYLFFCAEYREKMKSSNPDLSVKDIVSKLGILWKQLKESNSSEVKKFEKMSLDDRNRYKNEMKIYKNKKEKINKNPQSEHIQHIENEKKKQHEEEKIIKKSKKKEKDEGYSKFMRSKRNKTKKTHPELDSEGILKYLAAKWEKFPDTKKEKYRKKKDSFY